MLRRQFLQLISDLRAELERASEPAVGVSDYPTLKTKLNRVYETLYADFDWPHLTKTFDPIQLQAGERYYDFPEDLDFDRLTEKPVTWVNRLPIPIERGIVFADYAAFNSEAGVQVDPVVKWDVRYDDQNDKEMIEVWPIPASGANTLQFRGIQKFAPLVDDNDICRLDDKMIVLFAAAELAPVKGGNKQLFLQAANKRMLQVRGRAKTDTENFRIGLGEHRPRLSYRALVRVSGS